jgi:hypothetical protein
MFQMLRIQSQINNHKHQTMKPRAAATTKQSQITNYKQGFFCLRSRREGDKVQEVQYVSKVAKVDLG